MVRCRRRRGPRADGGEGLVDRVVEVVVVERCEQPVLVDEIMQPCSQLDEGDMDALCVEFGV